MRNSKRIPELLRIISKVWYKYPDLRLGQLILNGCPTDAGLYYMEDEDLIENLKRSYEEE